MRRAAARLGYQPDEVGRSLRRRETRTVGLVIADIVNPFFPALVKAVEEVLQSAGYGLVLADAAEDPDREIASIRQLLARRVDAMLLTPCHRLHSRAAVIESAQQVTTIQLDRYATPQADHIGMDHSQAVADVLQHLSDTGRQHPVFIGSASSMSTARDRQRAYVKHAAIIDSAAADRTLLGAFTADWGRQAAPEAMTRWPDTDALVCANDLIALGATEELARQGINVPEQVAVVGFDDTMFAVLKQPSLTSVRQPLDEMARRAVALITEQSHPASPQRVLLPAALIIRDSSAATKSLSSRG